MKKELSDFSLLSYYSVCACALTKHVLQQEISSSHTVLRSSGHAHSLRIIVLDENYFFERDYWNYCPG